MSKTVKANQEHINQVRQALSDKAAELVSLAHSSVEGGQFYEEFSAKLSDAMTALLQAPVK